MALPASSRGALLPFLQVGRGPENLCLHLSHHSPSKYLFFASALRSISRTISAIAASSDLSA